MEVFLIRGWVRNLPGCGKNTTLARGETLAARSLLDSHPTSNQPVRLGCSTPRGVILTRVITILVPGLLERCTGMDRFLVGG